MHGFAFVAEQMSRAAHAVQGLLRLRGQEDPIARAVAASHEGSGASEQSSMFTCDNNASLPQLEPATDLTRDVVAVSSPVATRRSKRPASPLAAPAAKRTVPKRAAGTLAAAREALHGQRIQADYHHGRGAKRITKTHIGAITYLGPDAGNYCLRVDWDDGTTETFALSRLLARGVILSATHDTYCTQ